MLASARGFDAGFTVRLGNFDLQVAAATTLRAIGWICQYEQ